MNTLKKLINLIISSSLILTSIPWDLYAQSCLTPPGLNLLAAIDMPEDLSVGKLDSKNLNYDAIVTFKGDKVVQGFDEIEQNFLGQTVDCEVDILLPIPIILRIPQQYIDEMTDVGWDVSSIKEIIQKGIESRILRGNNELIEKLFNLKGQTIFFALVNRSPNLWEVDIDHNRIFMNRVLFDRLLEAVRAKDTQTAIQDSSIFGAHVIAGFTHKLCSIAQRKIDADAEKRLNEEDHALIAEYLMGSGTDSHTYEHAVAEVFEEQCVRIIQMEIAGRTGDGAGMLNCFCAMPADWMLKKIMTFYNLYLHEHMLGDLIARAISSSNMAPHEIRQLHDALESYQHKPDAIREGPMFKITASLLYNAIDESLFSDLPDYADKLMEWLEKVFQLFMAFPSKAGQAVFADKLDRMDTKTFGSFMNHIERFNDEPARRLWRNLASLVVFRESQDLITIARRLMEQRVLQIKEKSPHFIEHDDLKDLHTIFETAKNSPDFLPVNLFEFYPEFLARQQESPRQDIRQQAQAARLSLTGNAAASHDTESST
ncbi:MAG: hypothetical protein ABII23_03435 [bacterium]